MSHYSSITSATLPGANLHVWQIEIPSVAVAYPFLMHQILAVSAFHLASLNPAQGQAHLSRAFQHQHHAISGIRAEVSANQSLPQDLIGPGTKIFITGGSGGVGSFTVQFAKALGATVTTTCSTANVQLCRSLGADEVIDYRKLDAMLELKKKGPIFDLVIDNVGTLAGMYEQSQHFLTPDGTSLQVAMQSSLSGMLRRSLLPSFLGGGKRQYRLVRANVNPKDLQQIGQWMAEAKVRAVIDQKFEWKDAPKAYEKLRLGRTVGKIVVHVGDA